MTLRCRGKEQLGGLYTGINAKHITLASKMVAQFSCLPVQPHKPIVGANAFAHKSGIHQHLNDEEIEALVSDEIFQPQTIWSLENVQVSYGMFAHSTVTVELVGPDGVTHVESAAGEDQVHAAYKAIDSIVQVPATVLQYSVKSVTEGTDAIAHSRVVIIGKDRQTCRLALSGEMIQRTFSGSGADMDLVVSKVRAYVSALNKMLCFIQQGIEWLKDE